MNDSYLLLLLVLSSIAVSDSVLSNFKENVRALLDTSGVEAENLRQGLRTFLQEKGDVKLTQKGNVQKTVKRRDMSVTKMFGTTTRRKKNIETSDFQVDPVFDSLKNRRLWQKLKEPKVKVTSGESSEMEMQFWMEDFGEQREHDKAKAYNASQLHTRDVLNMKMARPSGIPCGDPNQHDLPWGICIKPAACDDEYRIYRGDSGCGRSRYVCCAVIETAYDVYDAPDLSFEHDNSLTTDSDLDKIDTHEEKHREYLLRKHEKSKAKRTKLLLKKRIRNSISNIINEITRLVRNSYRNTTTQRLLKTQQLMAFVKKMKKQYRKVRQGLLDVHEFDMMKNDLALQASLDNIRSVNMNFMTNDTFRDIVVNGTVNKEELKKLERTHPVLSLFYKSRRMGGDLESEQTRTEEPGPEKVRSEIEENEPEIDEDDPRTEEDESETEEDEPETKQQLPKGLDYDVELGLLYY